MRTGTNLPQVKDYNQAVVLEIIRSSDGVSRVEIAERTGLTPQTVSNIVNRLKALGLVMEGGKEPALVGKPRTTVRTKTDGGFALGVRIGRVETVVLVVDLAGRVVARAEHRTLQEEGPDGIVRRVAQDVAHLVRESRTDPARILGLGVASPGPLDHVSGMVYGPPRLKGWGEVPLRAMLERETNYPVVVDNNAKAAAAWERWAGVAREVDNFAFVYMGTGVGAGLYIDGQLYRGSSSSAGAIGHVTVDPAGPRCACGGRGCVELYCAPPAVIARVRGALSRGEESRLAAPFREQPDAITHDLIARTAAAGDALALAAIHDSARMLSHGLVNLVNVLDIDLIVLGGKGFNHVGDVYREQVQQQLDSISYAHDHRSIDVRLSATEEDPGAMGAASLVLQAAFAPRLAGLVVSSPTRPWTRWPPRASTLGRPALMPSQVPAVSAGRRAASSKA